MQSGENMKMIESQLTISREQEGEVEHKKELLTIAEMKAKRFSQSLGLKFENVLDDEVGQTKYHLKFEAKYECGNFFSL